MNDETALKLIETIAEFMENSVKSAEQSLKQSEMVLKLSMQVSACMLVIKALRINLFAHLPNGVETEREFREKVLAYAEGGSAVTPEFIENVKVLLTEKHDDFTDLMSDFVS
jgi:hypothetical protein